MNVVRAPHAFGFVALLVAAAATTPVLTSQVFAAEPSATPVAMSEEKIHNAQKAWGEAVVALGKAHLAGEDMVARAREVVDGAYAFGQTRVLFKPTLAHEVPFRLTPEDAVSYFVTGHIPEDTGFAITPWTAVRFENAAISLHGNVGLAMGHYFFTNTSGEEIKVEYTKGYMLDERGNVRIMLQHSSVPYAPAKEPGADHAAN